MVDVYHSHERKIRKESVGIIFLILTLSAPCLASWPLFCIFLTASSFFTSLCIINGSFYLLKKKHQKNPQLLWPTFKPQTIFSLLFFIYIVSMKLTSLYPQCLPHSLSPPLSLLLRMPSLSVFTYINTSYPPRHRANRILSMNLSLITSNVKISCL